MEKQSSNSLKSLLLMKENNIGIYFTDDAIYCSFVKDTDSKAELIEHNIKEGIIKSGVVLDVMELKKELKLALSKISSKQPFANITLQSNLIFSTIIHLPSNITDASTIEKSIDLILNVELPWKKDSSYIDYTLNKNVNDTSVSIFSIKKDTVDAYISLFDQTNIKVLIVEFDALSTLRLMNKTETPQISITATEGCANIIITHGDKIDFLYSITTNKEINKELIKNELTRIKNYYSIETGIILDDTNSHLELSPNSIKLLGENLENINFFPALGASCRKLYLNGKDDNISLLDTKPNDLYRHHRILSSLKLVRQSSILVAVILIMAHMLFYSIISNIAERNSIYSSQPPKVYSSVSTIKSEARELNQAIEMGGVIIKQISRITPKINILDSIFTEGVYPNSITITGSSNPIAISGTAGTRTQYNNFRNSISNMNNIQIASFPLGNLNLQANIPFTISINILK